MMIAEDETGDREPRLASVTGGTGETKPHPRPSYGGLQEIVMLTLIEEPVGCRLLSLAIL